VSGTDHLLFQTGITTLVELVERHFVRAADRVEESYRDRNQRKPYVTRPGSSEHRRPLDFSLRQTARAEKSKKRHLE